MIMNDYYVDPNTYSDLQSDSAMIQAAVDEASRMGTEVMIPAHNNRTGRDIWEITEPINLYSGSSVVIRNAHLRIADDSICNIFKNSNCDTPLGTKKEGRQSYITIRGIGRALLDGGKYHHICENTPASFGYPPMYRSHSIHFQNVEHVVLENLHFKNHRYWAICLRSCAYGHLSNLFFSSQGNVPNQDGIDLRVGCHHISIENIMGATGDDLIALTGMMHGHNEALHAEGQPKAIHDIVIRNVLGYGICGCSLVRLLNNDGVKLYNITIDSVHETSPWSRDDAQVGINPDLYRTITESGHFEAPYAEPGKNGYRLDALIRIGENFWYDPQKGPAKSGDTYGITIRNLCSHSCAAVVISCTLEDSLIEDVRVFGNGSRAILCNDGEIRNVTFRDIVFTADCLPHPDDEHIHIRWNATDADGFSAVYFNRTKGSGLLFDNVITGNGLQAAFAGTGDVEIEAYRIRCRDQQTVLAIGENIKILNAAAPK